MKKIKFGMLILAVGVFALSFVSFQSAGQENKFRETKNRIANRYIVEIGRAHV